MQCICNANTSINWYWPTDWPTDRQTDRPNERKEWNEKWHEMEIAITVWRPIYLNFGIQVHMVCKRTAICNDCHWLSQKKQTPIPSRCGTKITKKRNRQPIYPIHSLKIDESVEIVIKNMAFLLPRSGAINFIFPWNLCYIKQTVLNKSWKKNRFRFEKGKKKQFEKKQAPIQNQRTILRVK